VVMVVVAIESVTALAITVIDGGAAFLVLGFAGLAGGWLLPLLGLGDRPWHERLIVGAGLGIGALSLSVLGLGVAGWLTRPAAFVLVGGLGLAGVARLVLDLLRQQRNRLGPTPSAASGTQAVVSPVLPHHKAGASHGPVAAPRSKGNRLHWLWLIVCPFVVIAILAACLPPGVLWGGPKAEEAYGYDVLEYHLAVPKAFFEQGRIGFLPTNVYSNFPLNSEMLSLLMMVLRGDPIEAAFMAQMANVVLAALLAASAWLAGSMFSRRAGLVAGIAMLTTPWTAYLAGIAYVEIGMLAMGMCALAVVLWAEGWPAYLVRRGLAAGLLAGLSIGFKYTALPLIAVPVAILLLFCRRSLRERLCALGMFVAGLLIAVSPWLVRNIVNTGNPGFPMGYSVFGARAGLWDAELEARWQKAHGAGGIAEPDRAVIVRLLTRTLGDYRMGGALVVLALAGAARRRDRWTLALLLILVWQALIWTFATHQYARFAVVMLLPLALLVGRLFEIQTPLRGSLIVWAIFLIGAVCNLYRLVDLYYYHTRVTGVDAGAGPQPVDAYGRTAWFVNGESPTGILNALDRRAKVMLVGEARVFYVLPPCEYATVFNHHPLAEAVRRDSEAKAVMQWLRQRGTRYILVHWGEVRRLRATYGFCPEINEELFDRLAGAGLKTVTSFSMAEGRPPEATLYEVPQ
jgi:hypothetical protein